VQLRALNRGELIATAGGALLGISLLLSWYTLGNAFAHLNSCHGPDAACSGWHALTILRYILLAAALAPAILSWIIIRGHALAWPRGEMTAVVAVVVLVLTVFRGLIDKPGAPTGEISINYGWWVALAGGLLILVGSVWRSQESAPRRKPPGVL
jgi:CDP-diglyceride synthetase